MDSRSKPIRARDGKLIPCRSISSQESGWVVIVSYLDYPFPAGISRRIEGIVAFLQEANFNVEVICPSFRWSHHRNHVNVSRVDLRFLRILGAERLPTKIVALILFNLFAFAKIMSSRRRILALQFESIYSFPVAFLAKVFCRCTCIGDDILINERSKPLACFARIVELVSDLVLCSTKDTLFKSVPKTRLLYVPTGVPGRFVLKRKAISFEKLRTVFVGALSYRANMKAVSHLLRASSDVSGDCAFIVVGGPVPKGLLQGTGVKFLGALDEGSLISVYKEANVGILPFFGIPAEGPKVKLLEYMAAQLLVISSPEGVEGYPDLIAWEHYVPTSSLEELKQVLARIRHNPDLYARIATRGHEFVMAHYQWSDLLLPYLDFMRADHGASRA